MSSIRLNTASGGSISITAPNTANTYTIALPTSNGTFVFGDSEQTLTNKTIDYANNTLTGVVGLDATQTLTNKTLTSPELTTAPYVNGSYRSNIVVVSALDINCSLGNYFTKTISTSSTFTFSNAPASRSYSFTLEVTHTSGTITWPSSVKWPGDEAPELTTGNTHLFIFVTDDGGTRWRGAFLVDYVN
jgi:hypothetical protein